MTGQDAVNLADAFNEQVGLTGIIMTRVDGDARGGAALSMRAVTGCQIKMLGVGETLDAIEDFHPDRLAGRILGMGDVVSVWSRRPLLEARRLKSSRASLKRANLISTTCPSNSVRCANLVDFRV